MAVDTDISNLFGENRQLEKDAPENKIKSLPDLTKSFASKTSAHGFIHLTDPKTKVFLRILWGFLILCFFGLFMANSVARVQEYNKSTVCLFKWWAGD